MKHHIWCFIFPQQKHVSVCVSHLKKHIFGNSLRLFERPACEKSCLPRVYSRYFNYKDEGVTKLWIWIKRFFIGDLAHLREGGAHGEQEVGEAVEGVGDGAGAVGEAHAQPRHTHPLDAGPWHWGQAGGLQGQASYSNINM